jgi:hypothetical protein
MQSDLGSTPYLKYLHIDQVEQQIPDDTDRTVEEWWSLNHNVLNESPEAEFNHEMQCAAKRENLQHLRKKQTSGISGVLCGIAHFLYEHVAA